MLAETFKELLFYGVFANGHVSCIKGNKESYRAYIVWTGPLHCEIPISACGDVFDNRMDRSLNKP
jgi:hypothetical protein